jgi:AcrR family transcriptional regulator
LKANAVRGSGSTRHSTGRPRSEKTRRAILKAAFQLLKRDGFDGVSAQQIAVEAGVSTATLYRWWDCKQAILLDAYLEKTREIVPYGKRGSPLARLRKYTLRIADFLNSENGRVFLRLLMAIQDNPALHRAFYEKVFVPRRSEGCGVVREAIAAGELPATVDPDFIINLLTGPQIVRALLHQGVDASSAQTLFDFVVGTSSRRNPAIGAGRR